MLNWNDLNSFITLSRSKKLIIANIYLTLPYVLLNFKKIKPFHYFFKRIYNFIKFFFDNQSVFVKLSYSNPSSTVLILDLLIFLFQRFIVG